MGSDWREDQADGELLVCVSEAHVGPPPQHTQIPLGALSGVHAETMIFSRYVKFVQSMRKSSKVAVQCLIELVSKDTQTNTGRNIRYIMNMTGESDIFAVSAHKLKRDYKFAPIQQENQWKVVFIKELTLLKMMTMIKPSQVMILKLFFVIFAHLRHFELFDIVNYI